MMQLIRDLDTLPPSATKLSVALGNFDGVHLGHQVILKETLARAKKDSIPAAVMMFAPHPREYFAPATPRIRLMSLAKKVSMLRQMGFDYILMLRFNAALAATSADDFIREILVEKLQVRHVVTGANFCFGTGRAGNSGVLGNASRHYGFSYHAVPTVSNDAGVISSSAIRTLLGHGDMVQARQLLGRPYTIAGHVIHGDKRGRTLGFPTANLPMHHLLVPRHGVYISHVVLEDTHYPAITNIGVKPTFAGIRPMAESYIFDFDRDIYGKKIQVELHHFLRDEKKFDSLTEIKEQITHDCEEARHYHAND